MNNFEHIRDFNISQLWEFVEKYLTFRSAMNPALDIETAFALVHEVHRELENAHSNLIWSTELAGLIVQHIGNDSRDGHPWAVTFHAIKSVEWYELREIYKYPASCRAATLEEAITRAAAVAMALLRSPESGGLK